MADNRSNQSENLEQAIDVVWRKSDPILLHGVPTDVIEQVSIGLPPLVEVQARHGDSVLLAVFVYTTLGLRLVGPPVVFQGGNVKAFTACYVGFFEFNMDKDGRPNLCDGEFPQSLLSCAADCARDAFETLRRELTDHLEEIPCSTQCNTSEQGLCPDVPENPHICICPVYETGNSEPEAEEDCRRKIAGPIVTQTGSCSVVARYRPSAGLPVPIFPVTVMDGTNRLRVMEIPLAPPGRRLFGYEGPYEGQRAGFFLPGALAAQVEECFLLGGARTASILDGCTDGDVTNP